VVETDAAVRMDRLRRRPLIHPDDARQIVRTLLAASHGRVGTDNPRASFHATNHCDRGAERRMSETFGFADGVISEGAACRKGAACSTTRMLGTGPVRAAPRDHDSVDSRSPSRPQRVLACHQPEMALFSSWEREVDAGDTGSRYRHRPAERALCRTSAGGPPKPAGRSVRPVGAYGWTGRVSRHHR
jgi:hypothetical protein